MEMPEKGNTMKTKSNLKINIPVAAAVCAAMTLAVPMRVHAQTQTQQQLQPPGYASTQTAPAMRVGFRMSDWKTIHGTTPESQEMITTLDRLGCEVNRQRHGDHEDVRFRCPAWRSIPVDSTQLADSWQEWLATNNFETLVLNPTADSPMPRVALRMARWKTLHVGSAAEARTAQEMYESIGCEVSVANHGDHFDASIRCPSGATIALPNEQAAHVWQDFLNGAGFETAHEHVGENNHDGHNHDGHDHSGHDHGGHDHGGHDHGGHDHGGNDHAVGFRGQARTDYAAAPRTFASKRFAGQAIAGGAYQNNAGPSLPNFGRPNFAQSSYSRSGHAQRSPSQPGYAPNGYAQQNRVQPNAGPAGFRQPGYRANYGANYPGGFGPASGPQGGGGHSGCGHAGCNH